MRPSLRVEEIVFEPGASAPGSNTISSTLALLRSGALSPYPPSTKKEKPLVQVSCAIWAIECFQKQRIASKGNR